MAKCSQLLEVCEYTSSVTNKTNLEMLTLEQLEREVDKTNPHTHASKTENSLIRLKQAFHEFYEGDKNGKLLACQIKNRYRKSHQ